MLQCGGEGSFSDLPAGKRLCAHVQLEHTGYHDHGIGPLSVLEHGVFQGFCAADKQPATATALIPYDPAAVAVLADEKGGGKG